MYYGNRSDWSCPQVGEGGRGGRQGDRKDAAGVLAEGLAAMHTRPKSRWGEGRALHGTGLGQLLLNTISLPTTPKPQLNTLLSMPAWQTRAAGPPCTFFAALARKRQPFEEKTAGSHIHSRACQTHELLVHDAMAARAPACAPPCLVSHPPGSLQPARQAWCPLKFTGTPIQLTTLWCSAHSRCTCPTR